MALSPAGSGRGGIGASEGSSSGRRRRVSGSSAPIRRAVIKGLRLKVLKPYFYENYKYVDGKSCMNIWTGESFIEVCAPVKWPNGWDHAAAHNIVIDNKVGRATIAFGTEP